MKITDYKYNPEGFEKHAYNTLKRKEIADEKLRKEEYKVNQHIWNLSLKYYEAYLDYMNTDIEHMGSFLGYIKHEYEMMKKTKPLFFNDDNMTLKLDAQIDKCVEVFEFYSTLYLELKNIAAELNEAIESFKENKFREDMFNLMALHQILAKIDGTYLILQGSAEEYRDLVGFKFVEDCLALRNTGIKFETYKQRSDKIFEEMEAQPE